MSKEEMLEVKVKELRSCQEKIGKTSCFSCEKVLNCQTKQEYVKAVYESMNQGSSGGFDF
jgi:hypothetical protein